MARIARAVTAREEVIARRRQSPDAPRKEHSGQERTKRVMLIRLQPGIGTSMISARFKAQHNDEDQVYRRHHGQRRSAPREQAEHMNEPDQARRSRSKVVLA